MYQNYFLFADNPAGITPIEVWISPLVRTLEYLIGHEPSHAHHTARAVRVNFAAEVHAFAIEAVLQRHAPHQQFFSVGAESWPKCN